MHKKIKLISNKKFQILFILDRINRRRYRESKKCYTTYTLSERYQLAENIRVAKIMKRTTIVIVILNLLTLPVRYWKCSKNRKNNFPKKLV